METKDLASKDLVIRDDATDPVDSIILGWRELVSMPDWGLEAVRAKIDTGARTSSMHVEELNRIGDRIEFVVLGDSGPRTIVAPLVRVSRVRPSTGVLEERYVVETTIRIGPLNRVVEISLSSREAMLAPILIGRRALKGEILVHPRKRYLHGRPKKVRKTR